MSDTPTAPRLQLGRELKALREDRRLSREAVAGALQCSLPKLSKVENGKASLSALEITTLLGLFDVSADSEQAQRILAVADAARQRSQLRVPEWVQAYVGMEGTAAEIRTFEIDLVPGLLQTEAYTRAVAEAAYPQQGRVEVQRIVSIRRERQARLLGDDPPQLSVILHEAALHIRVGGPETMREQLGRLLELAELPAVSLRLLPNEAGAFPSMGASFSIVQVPEGERIVYIEKLWTPAYVDRAARVEAYTHLWDSLAASALDATNTARRIRELVGELR